jgi:uncharacterized protein (DUF2164 family)
VDIKLGKDLETRMTASIRRYLADAFGEDVGDLKASLFLRFCMEEIAPSIYNLAVSDAQAYLQDRVADLESVCFATEFAYWNKGSGRTVARKPMR